MSNYLIYLSIILFTTKYPTLDVRSVAAIDHENPWNIVIHVDRGLLLFMVEPAHILGLRPYMARIKLSQQMAVQANGPGFSSNCSCSHNMPCFASLGELPNSQQFPDSSLVFLGHIPILIRKKPLNPPTFGLLWNELELLFRTWANLDLRFFLVAIDKPDSSPHVFCISLS